MKNIRFLLLWIAVIFLGFVQNASATSYFLSDIDLYSGLYYDAEKSPTDSDDNLMCWAASASNILAYTGWGDVYSFSEDLIFQYYQDNWTDEGSLPGYAWDWWFDGTNNKQGVSGWAQDNAVGGGGFYTSLNFYDYYVYSYTESTAASTIANFIKDNYGVSIGIYGPGGHALTVWGYEYDLLGNILGIYVSDSDDDKYTVNADNDWDYYTLNYHTDDSRWYLSGSYASWYIGAIQGLALSPYAITTTSTVPEPATLTLFGFGVLGMALRRRNTNK